MEINFKELNSILESGTSGELQGFLIDNNLCIKDGMIKARAPLKEQIAFWDKRQLARKILLNSVYGALLNTGCRFFDKRLGQSTTLTGRTITKHMAAQINQVITGNYQYNGDAIVYGDSVTGDTRVVTSDGEITIEDLFNRCGERCLENGKEYGVLSPDKVLGFVAYEDEPIMATPSYVMRHKTKKKLYKLTLDNGKSVTVTEDHSVMVDRNGFLLETTPLEILDSDLFICIDRGASSGLEWYRAQLESVDCLGEIDDYVYDISIDDQDPFFFGNDILLHNTDSGFFSAYPMLKHDIDNGKIAWNRDIVVELYDQISESVNDSFPDFMRKAFHVVGDRSNIIRAGREIVAETGLFIKKKRYAVLYYDKDGKRVDVNGSPGKLKAMGLDLKRSDTAIIVQEFLSRILMDILQGVSEEKVIESIIEFKNEFKKLPAWKMGSPKRVNNLTTYAEKEIKAGRCTMPGHVRAAINWNMLRDVNKDSYSLKITDGAKVLVCSLKPNPLGLTSVACPVDELRLPGWFTELPFDTTAMEDSVVNKKVENLIGVLGWDITSAREINAFNLFFG